MFDIQASIMTKAVEDDIAAKKEIEKMKSQLSFKVTIYLEFC